MSKGNVQVIYGSGTGKTTAAIGMGIKAAGAHMAVIMIQFLKGNMEADEDIILKRLEPEMKIFRFEKSAGFFETLSEQEKQEELINIKNGLNFAKKVLTTGECDMLILDEILGIVDQGIITVDELVKLIEAKEDAKLILTGQVFPSGLSGYVDIASKIDNVEVDNL